MKIFKDNFDAYNYIRKSNLDDIDKLIKITNIKTNGICKINNTIIIVDEYGLLD